jgi:hypothetical protein
MRAAVVLLGLLFCVPAGASEFEYKGWHFNTSAVQGEPSYSLVRSLEAQIDIVERLNLKPEIKGFFRAVDVKVDPSTLGGKALYRAQSSHGTRRPTIHRIYLSSQPLAPNQPVLLHMLLLAYLDERTPDGWGNRRLKDYFEQAQKSGAFVLGSRTMTNPQQFFAFSATAVLVGRAAEDSLERATVRKAVPGFYDWIVSEFVADGAL